MSGQVGGFSPVGGGAPLGMDLDEEEAVSAGPVTHRFVVGYQGTHVMVLGHQMTHAAAVGFEQTHTFVLQVE